MSEARHEVLTKQAGASEPGAGGAELTARDADGARKSRPSSPGGRTPAGALGNIANASTKSGVHSTDVLQRDAFTFEALRRMAPTTRPPANIPDYESAARVPPELGEPESSLARARRELLRMAGEDLPVAQPAAFGDDEVTTQRAQPSLLASFAEVPGDSSLAHPRARFDSSLAHPRARFDNDEDTVIQDVSELLAAADAQLDALTTEIRSVVTLLPAAPGAQESEPESELEIEVSEFCARAERASAPGDEVADEPPAAVALETPLVTPAHLAMLVRQTAREAAPPLANERAFTEPVVEPARASPVVAGGKTKRAIYAALLIGACAGLASMARMPRVSSPAVALRTSPASATSATPEPVPPAATAAENAAAPTERASAPSMLSALQSADEVPAVDSSDSAASLVARGQAALRAGQLRPARQWLTAAASRAPMNPHAHAGLTEADLLLGVPERALVAAQTALKLRPRRARYHLLIARVYDALGRSEDAAESRRQAQIVAPYDPDQPHAGEPRNDD